MDDIDALLGSAPGQALAGGEGGADDLSQLMIATLNEKNAPEILHFQQPLIERLEQALQGQEEYCEQLEGDMGAELKRMMLGLEVRRVRYLLKAYHRTRLLKVERFAATIMDNDDLRTRLSAAEAEYCHDYFVLLGRHLTDTVLTHLPPDFNSLVQVNRETSEGNDLIPQPVLDSHVFCKVLDDVGAVDLDGGNQEDMYAGSLYMVRYRFIAHLVESGKAVLT